MARPTGRRPANQPKAGTSKKGKDDESTPDQITIPEDLTVLSDDELATLHDTAVEAFRSMMPEDGSAPDDDVLDNLAVLADGIDALKAEVSKRDNAALERSNKAKDIASRVLGAPKDEATAEGDDDEQKPETDSDDAGAVTDTTPPEASAEAGDPAPVETPESVAASSARRRGPVNINLSGLRGTESGKPPKEGNEVDQKIAFAAQGAAGFNVGDPVSISDMAAAINSRLGGFNASAYSLARQRGNRQSERFTIAKIKREFPEEAVVQTEDPTSAMKFAVNEANTPQGSLVASGGWCSPSETLYTLVDISESANLVSVPEIQINRGGIRHTLGPDYRTVYEDTGFCYTEADDITGTYDGGAKPVTTVPCPDFTDDRLGYCGVIIGAGLLQQRGYPESIEDYIRKTLNAHAHRMSAATINAMVANSDAVTFPANQAGAAAPLLSAIDLQAMHYRAVNRMSDDATLETVLPTWTLSVLRADLARRLGLAEFEVSEARLSAWLSNRNVSAQYVVDWQDIATTAASAFTAPPTSVDFLLYAAGTHVKGVTDSITFENIYDSVLLGTNDYTALFTEDPYLVAKRNHDSRVVTVPLCADGSTNIGVDIGCDGTTA